MVDRQPDTPGRVALNQAAVEALASAIRGTVLQDGDDGYDEARRIWNGMIDKRPALIVRCAGAADVMAGLTFAREHDLLLSVRSGGHSAAGSAVADRGLIL